LVILDGCERKAAHVLQNCRNHAFLRDGTRPASEADGITREIDIVLFGPSSRSVRPATGPGEKTELIVALDQRLHLVRAAGVSSWRAISQMTS
jgi:hypothetical protein